MNSDPPVIIPDTENLREYYVSIEEIVWDYVPQGKNLVENRDFTPEELFYVGNGPGSIGSRYKKASKCHRYSESTLYDLLFSVFEQ